MATVLPFPLARRQTFIRRQANWYLGQGEGAAERNLRRQLQVQRDTLTRRGVDPPRALAETAALEAAIRAAIWLLQRGGAA